MRSSGGAEEGQNYCWDPGEGDSRMSISMEGNLRKDMFGELSFFLQHSKIM